MKFPQLHQCAREQAGGTFRFLTWAWHSGPCKDKLGHLIQLKEVLAKQGGRLSR